MKAGNMRAASQKELAVQFQKQEQSLTVSDEPEDDAQRAVLLRELPKEQGAGKPKKKPNKGGKNSMIAFDQFEGITGIKSGEGTLMAAAAKGQEVQQSVDTTLDDLNILLHVPAAGADDSGIDAHNLQFPTEIQVLQRQATRSRSREAQNPVTSQQIDLDTANRFNRRSQASKQAGSAGMAGKRRAKAAAPVRESEIPGLDELIAKYGVAEEAATQLQENYDSMIELQTQEEKLEESRKLSRRDISGLKKVHFQRLLSQSRNSQQIKNQDLAGSADNLVQQNTVDLHEIDNMRGSTQQLPSFDLHPSQLKLLDGMSQSKPSEPLIVHHQEFRVKSSKYNYNEDLPGLQKVISIDNYSQDRQSSPQPKTGEVDSTIMQIVKVHSQTHLHFAKEDGSMSQQAFGNDDHSQPDAGQSKARKNSHRGAGNQREAGPSIDELKARGLNVPRERSPNSPASAKQEANVYSASCNCTICQHFHQISKVEFKKREPLDLLKFFKDGQKEITHVTYQNCDMHMHSTDREDMEDDGMCAQTTTLELKCFNWLMHQLLPPAHLQYSLHGCELLFPDTAFFYITGPRANSGFVRSIIKTDQQSQCLTMTTAAQKTNHHAVRTSFSLLVRDRWNEQAPRQSSVGLLERRSGLGSKKSRGGSIGWLGAAGARRESAASSSMKNTSKSVDSSSRRKKDAQQGHSERQSQDTGEREGRKKEEGKDATRWKDQVIVRYKPGYGPDGETTSTYPLIRPMNELEFINVMDRRANDPFWRRLDSIQTGIKIERGPDRYFHVRLRNTNIYDLDDLAEGRNLTYNHNQFDEPYYNGIVQEIQDTNQDLEDFKYTDIQKEIERRMRKANPQEYCQRVAYKMATYVYTVHNIAILAMDVDFYKDDNDNIWMTSVDNIVVKNQQDQREVRKLSAIFIAGQKIINRIKERMRKDGLAFDEQQFQEAKETRTRNRGGPKSPSQFELLKQLEKDTAFGNMPADLRELEQSHDITTMTEQELQQATRRLTSQQKQRFFDRIKIKKLEKLLREMYLEHLKAFGLDSLLKRKTEDDEEDEMKLTADQQQCLLNDSALGTAKANTSKRSGFQSTETYQEVMAMNQRDFEREILRELRPEIDSARRLIDVIDSENKKANTAEIDDRVVKFLERRYGPRLQAITIKHMNNLNEQLIRKYQQLMRPAVMPSRSKPVSPRQPSTHLSQAPSVHAQSLNNQRLGLAKSHFLSKLGSQSNTLYPASLPPTSLGTTSYRNHMRNRINQMELSDKTAKGKKEGLLQEQLRKREQRLKEQDLEVFGARAYRDIIQQKRRSMKRSEIEEQQELRDRLIHLIDQAIEVKHGQQLPRDRHHVPIKSQNLDEKQGFITIESKGEQVLDSNRQGYDDELEMKRLQLLQALNKRKQMKFSQIQSDSNEHSLDLQNMPADAEGRILQIVSKMTSDKDEERNEVLVLGGGNPDYQEANETSALLQIRKLLTPNLQSRVAEQRYMPARTQQNQSIAKIVPVQLVKAKSKEQEGFEQRPLSQESKYYRKSQIFQRSSCQDYDKDFAIMTPNTKSVDKLKGLEASQLTESRVHIPQYMKRSSQLSYKQIIRDQENKSNEKAKSLHNPFVNGRIKSFAKMSKARLMASRLSNRAIQDQIKHQDQAMETTNQETTDAASSTAIQRVGSGVGSLPHFAHHDSMQPRQTTNEAPAISLSDQNEFSHPFPAFNNQISIQTSNAAGDSQPILMLEKQADLYSLPLTEEEPDDGNLVQARTKDGNVVLCDQYVAKRVKKQRNMLTQSMMVKREKREGLPWNKARQTMKQFYKENPKYDYYEQRKKTYKDIDEATEEFLNLSSQIGQQMDKVFGRGLAIPQYEEPEYHRQQDFEGLNLIEKIEDQQSHSSSNFYPQSQPQKSAFSKSGGRMPGFAAYQKGKSLKSQKHKSLQILPKKVWAGTQSNTSVLSSESRTEDATQPSKMVGPIQFTKSSMDHIDSQQKRTAFNKTHGQKKNEHIQANLSNNMFFDHRKHRRVGQAVPDDKLTTNGSNSSLFDRISRLNRLSSNASRGRVHQMPKKKVIDGRAKEQMKYAFENLKSQRLETQAAGQQPPSSIHNMSPPCNDDSMVVVLPDQYIYSREVEASQLAAGLAVDPMHQNADFSNTQMTDTRKSVNNESGAQTALRRFQQASSSFSNKNGSSELNHFRGSNRQAFSGFNYMGGGPTNIGDSDYGRRKSQDNKRKSIYSAPKHQRYQVMRTSQQSNNQKSQKNVQRYYHDRAHLKLTEMNSLVRQNFRGAGLDGQKNAAMSEEDIRIVQEGIQGTSLGNLTQHRSRKLQVMANSSQNLQPSRSSNQQLSEMPKLKIVPAITRNPADAVFDIQDCGFNLDMAGGNTNFSSSRRREKNQHDIATPDQSSFTDAKSPALPYYEIIAPVEPELSNESHMKIMKS